MSESELLGSYRKLVEESAKILEKYANPHLLQLEYIGEDETYPSAKVYNIKAISVTTTKNNRKYTEDELKQAARGWEKLLRVSQWTWDVHWECFHPKGLGLRLKRDWSCKKSLDS